MRMQTILRSDENSSVLAIEAPAKVNLHLAVKNKRPDGFHDLESIFMALEFGDTLYFEQVAADDHLEITMKGENLPNFALPTEENIIFKAVSMFMKRTGYNQGLRIMVEKRIPIGGGLGGGSSDAVSTLLALNILASDGKGLLNRASLIEMAASLGSDLPFFLSESGAAWVGGLGDVIKPVKAPKNLFFVLVNPGFSSKTAAAYSLLDESRAGLTYDCTESVKNENDLMNALIGEPRKWPFINDFLPVFLSQPENTANNAGEVYLNILAQLKELDAEFAGLTGTGSTCFGVFNNRETAEKARKLLSKTWNNTILTFPLAFEAK